jgi:catalase
MSRNNATRMGAITGALFLGGAFFTQSLARGNAPDDDNLPQQIFDTMMKVHGATKDHRPVHAKGIVCEGTFEPSREAAALSSAKHFAGMAVPITVRFSDGSPDPMAADNDPNDGPRGMAIRFSIPGGDTVDIVAMSHNGFVVSNGQEFLELQQSVADTDPSKPHPWPVEVFLSKHPLALKFVQENTIFPVSFATSAFFSNNSFVFVNQAGKKQAFRYKILPLSGQQNLSEADAKAKSAGYLMDDLKTRLAKEPIKYRLLAQLPNSGDSTSDSAAVWPEDRKTVELGTLSITKISPESDKLDKELAYDPTNLTAGIELSDDPLPMLRSKVYALSAAQRKAK